MRDERPGPSLGKFTARELYTGRGSVPAGDWPPLRARSAAYFFSAAMYTANGSSDSCATEELFCSDGWVVSRVFAELRLRRCCASVKFNICAAADKLMTTITASFLVFRRYESTLGSFSFKAMYWPSRSAELERRSASSCLYQFRIEFGSFSSSATL